MKGKNDSLQVLRALAFIGVFISHLGFTHLGGIGVEIFLLLSGFLMTLKYLDNDYYFPTSFKSAAIYSLNKIQKLYRLHLITTIAAIPILLINNLHKEFCFIKIATKLLLNIFLLQAWVPVEEFRYSMNNLSWYLCVASFTYFLFPFIINWIRRRADVKKIILLSALIILLECVYGLCVEKIFADKTLVQGLTYNFPVFRALDFILGCNLGYLFFRSPASKTHTSPVFILISVISIFITEVLVSIAWDLNNCTWFKNTIILLPAGCFSIVSFYTYKVNKKNQIWDWLVKLGNISAYTYLIHELIIRYLNMIITKVLHIESSLWIKISVGIIAFCITICLANIYSRKRNKYEVRES